MPKRKIKSRKQNRDSKIIATKDHDKPENINKRKPLFSLHYLNDEHCITKCESKDKNNFLKKLKKISQMTWQEIQAAPRHGLGTEKIDADSLKVGVPNHLPPDYEPLLAFRYSSKKPMVGFRINEVFHIVWIEKNYGDLYDH